MKTIKVSRATDEQLDYLCAMCEGAKGFHMHTYAGIDPGPPVAAIDWEYGWTALVDTRYTTDPVNLQSIMDRLFAQGMRLTGYGVRFIHDKASVQAQLDDTVCGGSTYMVAVARLFITTQLGENVEVPEELA
jgi:hypothetical protein